MKKQVKSYTVVSELTKDEGDWNETQSKIAIAVIVVIFVVFFVFLIASAEIKQQSRYDSDGQQSTAVSTEFEIH